jgi:hypothetical protein
MVPVAQYTVRVPSSRFLSKAGRPSLAVLLQATIFSPIQAASPDGESCRAAPRVEGFVACWWA